MKYHILQTHPQLGKLLSERYPALGTARRNVEKMDGVWANWTYEVVRCLDPQALDCSCSRDDTFESVPGN